MEETPFGPAPLPRHIAVIMDGNGRWAKQRGLARTEGHRAGMESIRTAVRCCSRWGIGYLTLYAFSTDNWKRPLLEVDFLMNLLQGYLQREIDELHKNNVRFRVIGRTEKFSKTVRALIEAGEKKTAANTGLTLVLALNYGARSEILEAARLWAREALEGKAEPEALDEEKFAARLETRGMPDPDLLIRTSGEMRLSNFLLWQASYAELWFTPAHWPEFGEEHMKQAICDFQSRSRRYGGV